jgi:hypothetical protein
MDELQATVRGDEVWFPVRVQPRASRDGAHGIRAGALRVSLTAPPVDGEANAALIEWVASALRVPRRDVRIAQGETSRSKIVAVRGTTLDAVRRLANG